MPRRSGLVLGLLCLVLNLLSAAPAALPGASWDKLPAWRGFNLLEKFHQDWSNGPFQEDDFRLVAQYGFNFVRLPMDYRTYISGGDWLSFDESALAEIDQAVAWGEQYGIHVQLNLHRIPGFTVASPAEATSLWSDSGTQLVAAAHWAMFAKRYRGIPNARLSFNLLNEPPGSLTGPEYAAVVEFLADAIRVEDPERLIVADGLAYATQPVPELIPLQVAQSMHNYEPFNLTHYQAGWVDGSDDWAVPEWPGNAVGRYLYGPAKSEFQTALIIDGPFDSAVRLRIRVAVVSDSSRLTVSGGGQTLFDHFFEPGPGTGDWEMVVYREEWDIYQNSYNRDYFVDVPAGVEDLSLLNLDGDWMTITEIGIQKAGVIGHEAVLAPGNGGWGVRQEHLIRYRQSSEGPTLTAPGGGRLAHWADHIQPWKDLQGQGVGVMIGEWGVYNRTPHPVALAWMRDMLENYTLAGFGWSLWNFRDTFGPINSGRLDVVYQSVDGGQLDRAMMDLLQEFSFFRENYEQWANRVFPPDAEVDRIGREDDFDNDGLNNLWAYALGLGEDTGRRTLAPEVASDPVRGGLLVRVTGSARAVGMAIGAEVSTDLKIWIPVDEGPSRMEEREDGPPIHEVRLALPEGRPFFYRLTLVGPR